MWETPYLTAGYICLSDLDLQWGKGNQQRRSWRPISFPSKSWGTLLVPLLAAPHPHFWVWFLDHPTLPYLESTVEQGKDNAIQKQDSIQDIAELGLSQGS